MQKLKYYDKQNNSGHFATTLLENSLEDKFRLKFSFDKFLPNSCLTSGKNAKVGILRQDGKCPAQNFVDLLYIFIVIVIEILINKNTSKASKSAFDGVGIILSKRHILHLTGHFATSSLEKGLEDAFRLKFSFDKFLPNSSQTSGKKPKVGVILSKRRILHLT